MKTSRLPGANKLFNKLQEVNELTNDQSANQVNLERTSSLSQNRLKNAKQKHKKIPLLSQKSPIKITNNCHKLILFNNIDLQLKIRTMFFFNQE
jgi:hypothetical protein